MREECPFCAELDERSFLTANDVLGIWDAFPVSPGHALLLPRRHIETWFDATVDEQRALVAAVEIAKGEIEKTHHPDGYNIGINSGEAAGQTVGHLHVHVIPRYKGDVDDPRGGIRQIFPGNVAYWET